MKKRLLTEISTEVVAAFLDGNATAEESRQILMAMAEDEELREVIRTSLSVDAELCQIPLGGEAIPAMAMAATCNEENYCCLECEKQVLDHFDIAYDDDQLLEEAIAKGWQQQEGTALHNVGRHLEAKGFTVERRFRATLADLAKALEGGCGVIVAVDGGELLGDRAQEILEDLLVGEILDHTVVVKAYDVEQGVVAIFDPNSPNAEDRYPVEQFEDAWNDSKNYMVTALLER